MLHGSVAMNGGIHRSTRGVARRENAVAQFAASRASPAASILYGTVAAVACLLLLNGCNLLGNVPGGNTNGNSNNPPVIDADNNPDQAANPPAIDINGNWRFEGSGSLSTACVTLENRRISTYFVNCGGSATAILNAPVGYIGGSSVTQGLAISLAADGSDSRYAILTFYLTVVDDNTMSGTAAQSIYPDDVTTSHDVVWTRQ
jgi:hypothetical protein